MYGWKSEIAFTRMSTEERSDYIVELHERGCMRLVAGLILMVGLSWGMVAWIGPVGTGIGFAMSFPVWLPGILKISSARQLDAAQVEPFLWWPGGTLEAFRTRHSIGMTEETPKAVGLSLSGSCGISA